MERIIVFSSGHKFQTHNALLFHDTWEILYFQLLPHRDTEDRNKPQRVIRGVFHDRTLPDKGENTFLP